MIVTKIERQSRNKGRVSIFLDGSYAFGLGEEVLLRLGLRKGDQVTEEDLPSILESEEYSRARQAALRAISRRMKSEREIAAKLTEKEFHPTVIRRVITSLIELRLLDDERLARACLHDIQLRSPAGTRLLKQQLLLRGIPIATIEGVLSGESVRETEERRALKAAMQYQKKQARSSRPVNVQSARKRLSDFLARRGFNWSTIGSVLRSLHGADQEDAYGNNGL